MCQALLLIFVLPFAVLASARHVEDYPLFFVPNRGQTQPSVRFAVQKPGLTALLLHGEIDLRVHGLNVRMRFERANPQHWLEGHQALPGHANFMSGPETDWRVNLPMYGTVVYRHLFRGIDMEYGSEGRNLKSEFHVGAGADPSDIRVRYVGAGHPWIEADGTLTIPIQGGELREHAPLVYQWTAGSRRAVSGRFRIHSD